MIVDPINSTLLHFSLFPNTFNNLSKPGEDVRKVRAVPQIQHPVELFKHYKPQ
jgi:hypothetical protein